MRLLWALSIVSHNGQPNVTWVESTTAEDRDTFFANLDVDPEWKKFGPNTQIQMHIPSMRLWIIKIMKGFMK